jgi:integrase/recombinase XerD
MKQAKLLTDAEVKRLTAVINSLRYPTRNRTIVALSFYAGLRACEIAELKVGDVFDRDGNVNDTIYLSASQTKGSDSCTVLVNSKLQKQLVKYAVQYPEHVLKPYAKLIFSPSSHYAPQHLTADCTCCNACLSSQCCYQAVCLVRVC